ncbi:MAG: HPr family phosphocarrier protein [Planctomycetaceae bacterium]
MFERTITVKLSEGLHVRPMSLIAAAAGRYRCDVFLCRDELAVNAKSMMEMMALAAEQGTVLVIRADGPQETEAVDSVVRLFESGFAGDATQPDQTATESGST